MKSTQGSVASASPQAGAPLKSIIFSGTALELSLINSQERNSYQASFSSYPEINKIPIDTVKVGDTALYDRVKLGDVATYEIEEIHEHGADDDQRVVVARKVFPVDEKAGTRTIFNARFLLGSKSLDLYNPTKSDVVNIESCVATRQDLNRRGGYRK